jgi:C-terminal processing protease CtpA/Prc
MRRLSFLPVSLLVALALSCGKPPAPVESVEPPPEPVVEPDPGPAAPVNPVLPALDTYPPDVQRLAHLGRLWGAVRYLHPYLAYRDIDWDAAGLDAIAAVSAASDDAAYLDAVRAMLTVLGDPATRVSVDESAGASSASRVVSHLWQADDVLVVNMGTANSMASYHAFAQIGAELVKARGVIFDLRDVGVDAWLEWMFPDVAPLLISAPVEMPAERGIVHSGYRPQTGATSGGYYSAFSTTAAVDIQPSSVAAPERVVFLVGEEQVVPGIAIAMQAAGQAAIVAPNAVIGAQSLGKVTAFELGAGHHAAVRTTEPIFRGTAVSVNADATYDGDGMAVAEAVLKDAARRASPTTGAVLPSARWAPDATYADQELPGRALRILAAYRLWNVIDRFYPYLHLIGDWDRVLPLAISELAAAETAEDYARAVARIAALVADTHTHTYGGKTRDVFGYASPLGAGIVEGEVVVLDADDIVTAMGVAVGDVIETVDGVPIAEAMDAARPYVAGSTVVVAEHQTLYRVLRGQVDTTVELGLRGPDGPKVATVKRSPPQWPQPSSSSEPYRVLEVGIGYVDLRELEPAQVGAMFEALKATPAIIFDMRGYPNGTAWSIAPRLDRSGTPTVGASFQRCLVSGLTGGERGRYLFEQNIPASDDPKYEGRTYMLINHETISQAEHTGLFFEAANATEFIGTHTSGANGDVTNMSLPGGLYVGFTGHDVRHADGRQLQRIGLVPHLRVAPTIEGIRDDDDEVLDAAIDYALDRVK